MNVPVLGLETLQRPACLEPEVLLAFLVAGVSEDDNTATVQIAEIREMATYFCPTAISKRAAYDLHQVMRHSGMQ